MVEQILPDIYRIEIPLPASPLKALNSYVLTGGDRFLVVDTGWNREECLRAMLSGLKRLKVNLDRTDFFITHAHADHMGLAGELLRKGCRAYMGEADAAVLLTIRRGRKERIERLSATYLSYGFPEPLLRKALENHPGLRFGPQEPLDFSALREGDRVDLGDHSFLCIETPGHSPGHMCLYEPNKKVLLSGDHILSDITPNITSWPEMKNSLGSYLASLEKVSKLDVDLVLPGHRRTLKDHRKRIAALREHHRNRLDEARRALEPGEKTAWEVAAQLTWDIDVPSWEGFPLVQKWFAVSEAAAHLRHLEVSGTVACTERNGKRLFSLI